MYKKTFEDKAVIVDRTATELALMLLNLNGDKSLISYTTEDNLYYVPDLKSIYLNIDILPLLAYRRDYGLMKTKAMLKPWLSNLFTLHNNIDAVCFIKDGQGRAVLSKANKIELSQVKPQTLIFKSEKHKDIILIHTPV